jgi:UDP-N-acetyl-D-mannosaminuronic acid transferase (WecB/TagA/CpsF family)
MRHIGLEWLYRLAKEPKRLARRYLVGNLVFLAGLVREGVVITAAPSRPRPVNR